jgi:hypothetical protein
MADLIYSAESAPSPLEGSSWQSVAPLTTYVHASPWYYGQQAGTPELVFQAAEAIGRALGVHLRALGASSTGPLKRPTVASGIFQAITEDAVAEATEQLTRGSLPEHLANAVRNHRLTNTPEWTELKDRLGDIELFAIESSPLTFDIDEHRAFSGRARVLLELGKRGNDFPETMVIDARVFGLVDKSDQIQMERFEFGL